MADQNNSGRRVFLDPLGFSREEAEAMVGKRVIQMVTDIQGNAVAGRKGEVVASEQTPRYSGNAYQFFVSIIFTDRDGNRSRPWLYSKEQLKNHTRLLEEKRAGGKRIPDKNIQLQREQHRRLATQFQQNQGPQQNQKPNGGMRPS